MSLFKKLSQILTPPTSKPTPEPVASTGKPRADAEVLADLRYFVRDYVTDLPGAPERVAQAEANLRRLSLSHGLYSTAAKMRLEIDALRRREKQDLVLSWQRGYALAGELVYRYVINEIASLEQGRSTVGPNILTTYVLEMVELKAYGGGTASALGPAIRITERLLQNAIEAHERRHMFMGLAVAVVRAMGEQLERMPGPARRSGAEATFQETAVLEKARHIKAFTGEFEDRIRKLHDRLTAIEVEPQPSRDEIAARRALGKECPHLNYLRAVLGVAQDVGYLPFVATLEEKIAAELLQSDSAQSQRIHAAAARRLEEQGGHEAGVGLRSLAGHRYQMAAQLYLKALDPAGAERAQTKAKALSTE